MSGEARVDWDSKRHKYIDAILSDCHGLWPDLEGLIRDIYVSYLKLGDVAIDVGVNHGTHLFQMAEAVGASGRILGVEAVPAHVASVEALLKGPYKHLSERIELHCCAVSSEPGKAEFFVSKINDGGLSGLQLRDVMSESEFEKIEVDVKTLDDFINFHSNICFVKIDVEGAEFDALSGAPKLLGQRPVIIFEYDSSAANSFGFDPRDLLELFNWRKFDVFDIFGFPIDGAEALNSAQVWNFIAVPAELDGAAITAPARRTLEAKIVGLEDLSPKLC